MAVVAYRRRRDDTGCPAQTRYNLPIEILYTVDPDDHDRGASSTSPPATRPRSPSVGTTPTSPSTSSATSGPGTSTTSTPTSTRWVCRASWTPSRASGRAADAGTCRWTRGCGSCSLAATSSTRSGSRRSCSRWTSSRAAQPVRGHADQARAPSPASAPSCAGRTTRGCCSTSRSSRQAEYDAHMAELRTKGQVGTLDTGPGPTRTLRRATAPFPVDEEYVDQGEPGMTATAAPRTTSSARRPQRPARVRSSSAGSPAPTTR